MQRLLLVAIASLLIALAGVARVDRCLVRWYEESLAALLRPTDPRPTALEAPLHEEEPASASDEPAPLPTPPPASIAPELIGRSREALRKEFGTPLFSDEDADWIESEEGHVWRFQIGGGFVRAVRDVGMEASHRSDRRVEAPLGRKWDALLAEWGQPTLCEAGEWWYAAAEDIAGVRVRFEQGVVIGNEPLPWYWQPPSAEEGASTPARGTVR